ncbi:MAG: ABC-2 transporter permease [Pirellula sp.]|jgi:ABC-type transport system involved in multi-copper enzyme maturation permease subunit
MSSLETNTTYTTQRPGNLSAPIAKGQLWGRVLFKESRPLIPLLLSLAILSLLGHVLVEIQREFNSLDVMFHAMPYALNPILFGLGAAALLVSQEKEQRTLLWYSSLPIAPRTIVQSKFIVGSVGVCLSWLISLCIASPFSAEVLRVRAESPTDILYVLPLTAFFVYSVTFCLTWIFGTAMPALLTLVPVVLMTILTASVITGFTSPDYQVHRDTYTNTSPIVWLVSYLFTVVVVGSIAWRTGSRSFVATGGRTTGRTDPSKLAYRSDTSFFSFNRAGETGALLWHAWRQNRGLILASIGTGLASWMLFNFEHYGQEAVLALTFVAGSFAFLLTWVGALSIGADQHLRRIHFLAERGVSPSKIWLSRVVVPFAVLVFLVLIVVVGQWWLKDVVPNGSTRLIAVLVAAAFSFVAIAVSQWWGQLGLSRVVTLCGAPLTFALAIGYYSSIVSMFIAPLWLVLAMLVIPPLAMRLSMRSWLDRRFNISYYILHGLFFGAAVVIPLVPFGFQLATVPRMSSVNQQLYLNEYKQYLSADSASEGWTSFLRFEAKELPFQITVPPIEVLIKEVYSRESSEENSLPKLPVFATVQADNIESNLSPNLDGQDAAMGVGLEGPGGAGVVTIDAESLEGQFLVKTLKELPPLGDVMEQLVAKFEEAIDRNPRALRYSTIIDQIETEALQKGFAVTAKPDDEKLKKRWESSVRLLGKIASSLRKSVTILDQNHADTVEQTILQILQTDIAKQSLDKGLYQSLADQIADGEARKRSRRRALLYSWQQDTHNLQSNPDRLEFQRQLGGIDLYGFRRDKILKQTFIAKTQRDRIVDLLIQYASAGDEGTKRNIKSELEKTLSPEKTRSIISKWHGNWEKQASSISKL